MNKVKIQFALLLATVLWASAFIGIKVGLHEYSPGALALLRFIVASLCMGGFYFCLPSRVNPSLQEKCELLLLGIAGIGVYHTCLNYGEVTVTAGVASFIIGLIPVFSVMLSVIFLKERPPKGVWLGMTTSMLGLLLILKSDPGSSFSLGIGMIFISAIMGAVQFVFQKNYLSRYHPITVTTWILWGGTLSMCIFTPTLSQELPTASAVSTLAAIYLGIFPAAIAYLIWSYALESTPVSNAALYLYAMPFISTLLGIYFLNEMPSMLSLIGGMVALLGAIVAQCFTGTSDIDKPAEQV